MLEAQPDLAVLVRRPTDHGAGLGVVEASVDQRVAVAGESGVLDLDRGLHAELGARLPGGGHADVAAVLVQVDVGLRQGHGLAAEGLPAEGAGGVHRPFGRAL